MKYKLSKLKNGLRVIVIPMPTLESATVTIWVGVGSRYERAKVNGLSHFLEHMVFKGSKKRPTAKAIATAIDSFGGEFNASTSKDWTNFYIKARSAKMDIACDVLSDMVLNPLLRSSDIDREKGVIAEEIAMYNDTPIAKIGDYFENLIYKGNSLGMDIAGTRSTVYSIKQADFKNYINSHYSSNNVVLTIAGGISEKMALDMAEKYFSGLTKKTKKKFTKFSYKYKKPRVYLKSKDIEQAHLIMGFLGYPRGHKMRFAEAVLASVLGGGMSSRMFTEVREKRGLAYAVKSSTDHMQDTGYFSTYAGVDLKRIDEAIAVILDQYWGISNLKLAVGIKEMNKAKEYVKGHLALSLEDTKSVNSFFGLRQLLEDKVETPEDVYKRIDNVKIEDLTKVAKEIFLPEKLNLAIIGPYKSAARFEQLLK